jgi:hypothetical protein
MKNLPPIAPAAGAFLFAITSRMSNGRGGVKGVCKFPQRELTTNQELVFATDFACHDSSFLSF